jgi:starch-binding outer membrane protein, SusD/RagB family
MINLNNMKKISIFFIGLIIVLSGCEKFTEPAPQNNGDFENIYTEPNLAQGFLMNGYTRLPSNFWSFTDVATDDAVTNEANNNQPNNGFRRVATGQWTSNFNPFDQWTNSRAGIQYINIFLAEVDKVRWDSNDPKLNDMFKDRMKGEAYGLRAYLMFYLLQNHAGWLNGELFGAPILLEPETPFSNFNVPRAKFEDCLKQIYSDLDKAEELLPLDYNDISVASSIPTKYAGVSTETYNRVFGRLFKQLMSGRIAEAIRAKVSLLAASPAFSKGNTITWVKAAEDAADVLNKNNGVNGLATNGVTWYDNRAEIDALASGNNPPEILWRSNIVTNSDLEAAHYPPMLNGRGSLNPTQNLVDAFPMANGYPISNTALSGYNSTAPYTGRDPRLARFIVINGSTSGPSNTVTNTSVNGLTDDALNKVATSTRTGYYMRKLLRQDVSRNSASINNQKHYKPHIRFTEMYLAYAEAANEAYGPMGMASNSTYSAYDVIKAIRRRAGVGLNNGDAYLESIKTDKILMKALIKNERRLELCFEGFRFWDLRRWNEDLKETAKGISINNTTYQVINVEERNYQDFMRFGPIPNSEILKFSSLNQNTGW